MKTATYQFADNEIEILKAEEELIDVGNWIKDLNDFKGDLKVDLVVKFKDSFSSLVGKYDGQYGKWDKARLADEGIVVLEHYYDEAKKLMDQISDLANKIVEDNNLYDDKQFCLEYFNLAKAGYEFLNEKEKEFKMDEVFLPVSLERAGLVSTRLVLGKNLDERLDDEVRVVTKRTHLIQEPGDYLTVTVKWREKEKLSDLNNQNLLLSDFVNPASGASGAALVIALLFNKVKPKKVIHRSICSTQQGTMFIRKAINKLGVKTSFYSLGECDRLNEMYYLIGNRTVGDAGRILRHFLPKWYKL